MDTDTTDRLKSELAARLAALMPYLTSNQALTFDAANDLLGVVIDGVDVALGGDDLDPSPWPEGAPVRLIAERDDASLSPGSVARVVETDGEVHTIWVRWPGHPGTTAFSPRELRRVQ